MIKILFVKDELILILLVVIATIIGVLLIVFRPSFWIITESVSICVGVFALPDTVTFKKVTLSLKSETTLSLYFTSDKDLTFSCNEDKRVEAEHEGTTWIARIRGIKAKEIGDDFTLTVSDGTNSGDVTYSPITYCYNVLDRGTDNVNLKNVVTALYWYWQNAKAYFNY